MFTDCAVDQSQSRHSNKCCPSDVEDTHCGTRGFVSTTQWSILCVLLLFIKPILGNRFGPRASSEASRGARTNDSEFSTSPGAVMHWTCCNTREHTATQLRPTARLGISLSQRHGSLIRHEFMMMTHFYPTHCHTLQHTATHCNTLEHTGTHWNTLEHTGTHWNTLEHTGTHWNTLEHTGTHCKTLQLAAIHFDVEPNWSLSQAKSEWHGLMQHDSQSVFYYEVSKICKTLQHPATHCNTRYVARRNIVWIARGVPWRSTYIAFLGRDWWLDISSAHGIYQAQWCF